MRLTLLTGNEVAAALTNCRVIVVGVGGVGSWCAEALVRSGVGNISLIDSDIVCVTNTNRQIQATNSSIGRLKAQVLAERLQDINPFCTVKAFPELFTRESAGKFDISGADYVIDAIDTLEFKLDLIESALSAGCRLFSSMGMAKKLDPSQVKSADIWKTSGCSLARLVRQGLRKRNINTNFLAVYSTESFNNDALHEPSGGKKALGSAVTVTATAGFLLASLVIRDIIARFSPANSELQGGFYE